MDSVLYINQWWCSLHKCLPLHHSSSLFYKPPHTLCRWTYRSEVAHLRLDVEALAKALAAHQMARSGQRLGAAAEQVVYMSRATLVVVPAVLIGHWYQQVKVSVWMLCAGGRQLRVWVVYSGRGG